MGGQAAFPANRDGFVDGFEQTCAFVSDVAGVDAAVTGDDLA